MTGAEQGDRANFVLNVVRESLAVNEAIATMCSPGFQRAKSAADGFTTAMDNLRYEAGVSGEDLERLKQDMLTMGIVSGMGPEFAANAVAQAFAAARYERERRALWASLYPQVAALGKDAPHISICDGPSPGDLVWSWWSKGQRHWQCAP
jgi:hypothetical protein